MGGESAGGRTVEWDAEIINEIPNELIGWRTVDGADVVSAGSVNFKPAPGYRGTEVRVRLQYAPPAGKVGARIASLFGHEPSQTIKEDVRRFKQLIEAGEVATTEGQPRGRYSHEPAGDGDVHQASVESFPASDSPAYNY